MASHQFQRCGFTGLAAGFAAFILAASGAYAWGPPTVVYHDASNTTKTGAAVAVAPGPVSGSWSAAWTAIGPYNWDEGVAFSRTTDGGVTWSPPVDLSGRAGVTADQANNPVLAPVGADLMAAWDTDTATGNLLDGSRDIIAARSPDGGATWGAPVTVNTDFGDTLLVNTSPAIAGDGGGRWVAVWERQSLVNGAFGIECDIFSAASADSGATWSAPVPVNAAASDSPVADWSPRVATDGAGTWVTVWEDYLSSGGIYGDILMSRSTTNGASWSAPATVSPAGVINGAPDPSLDLQASVAYGGGTWVVVWSGNERTTTTVPFTSTIQVVRSTDGGVSFGSPVTVAASGPAGSVDSTPRLAHGNGTFTLAWLRLEPAAAARVLSSSSFDGGVTWTTPTQAATGGFAPSLAVKPNGALAVAFAAGNEDRSGDIMWTGQFAPSAGAADWQLYQ
jgi:hypothetical protein